MHLFFFFVFLNIKVKFNFWINPSAPRVHYTVTTLILIDKLDIEFYAETITLFQYQEYKYTLMVIIKINIIFSNLFIYLNIVVFHDIFIYIFIYFFLWRWMLLFLFYSSNKTKIILELYNKFNFYLITFMKVQIM